VHSWLDDEEGSMYWNSTPEAVIEEGSRVESLPRFLVAGVVELRDVAQ